MPALLSGAVLGQEETNIVKAVSGDESAGWESAFSDENLVPFHINFYAADGLYYEIVESGKSGGSFFTTIFSEKRRFTGRLGAKLRLDAALYDARGGLPPVDNDIAVRSFRVNTFGRGFFLSPLTYGLEFGLANGKFYFNDGYIWFHEVPYVAGVRFGIFTAPLSMAALKSSSHTPLMEDPAPVSAFSPGDMLGFQLGGAISGKQATVSAGWFADVNDNENRDASQSYSRFIGRATWLPVEAPGTNGARRVHLGVSGSTLFATGEGVQYRSRPESYLAPFLIDTGTLGGDRATILAAEAAWQHDRFLVESEVFMAQADDAADRLHRFGGFYVQSSLFLTGETREYNHETGRFSGAKIRSVRSLQHRSWGALEWANRFSHTDLSDGTIRGGVMNVASTGLNLYISERMRIMVDAGYADIENAAESGDLLFAQGRFQINL